MGLFSKGSMFFLGGGWWLPQKTRGQALEVFHKKQDLFKQMQINGPGPQLKERHGPSFPCGLLVRRLFAAGLEFSKDQNGCHRLSPWTFFFGQGREPHVEMCEFALT